MHSVQVHLPTLIRIMSCYMIFIFKAHFMLNVNHNMHVPALRYEP